RTTPCCRPQNATVRGDAPPGRRTKAALRRRKAQTRRLRAHPWYGCVGMIAESQLCSVARKCSTTGLACGADDRACQSDAVARGLEVVCEHPDPRSFVYCPPGATQRDSAVVWIMLFIAIGIAV